MRIDKAFCDNCGKEDLYKCFPVTLSCGYGSIFDELTFEFCSDQCCVDFIQKKMKECESGKGYTLPLREEFEKKIDVLNDKKEIKNE